MTLFKNVHWNWSRRDDYIALKGDRADIIRSILTPENRKKLLRVVSDDDLLSLTFASCSCLTNSNDHVHHDDSCPFHLVGLEINDRSLAANDPIFSRRGP